MADLVSATRVNRHGIYAEFGGKKELFLTCLEKYQELVVSPAFDQVEQEEANLDSVLEYLKFQIRRAEESGLPGPGCLVANTMTECGPHDRDIEKAVSHHNQRLTDGFAIALRNENSGASAHKIRKLAFLSDGVCSGIVVRFSNRLRFQNTKTICDYIN